MTPLHAWGVRAAVVAAGLAAVMWGGVWLLSERRLHATDGWPRAAIGAVPAGAASVGDGARLGRVLGCVGCHGPALAGGAVPDARTGVDLVAPNLTRVVAGYTDDELARAIRAGVGRDGRALFGMPARGFRHLADEDVRRLVAWLRSLAVQADATPVHRPGFALRLRVLTGAALPDALALDPSAPLPAAATDALARGRRLAHVACGECHGATLEGDGARVPPLTVAVAYTEPAFTRLMRTGETPGGRDLYLMDDTARARFSHLTDEEIASLYAYLRARAGQ